MFLNRDNVTEGESHEDEEYADEEEEKVRLNLSIWILDTDHFCLQSFWDTLMIQWMQISCKDRSTCTSSSQNCEARKFSFVIGD